MHYAFLQLFILSILLDIRLIKSILCIHVDLYENGIATQREKRIIPCIPTTCLPNIAIVIPVIIIMVPIVTARQACHKQEVVTRPSIRKLWKVGMVTNGLGAGVGADSMSICDPLVPFKPLSILDR